jgi:hypothetical protein
MAQDAFCTPEKLVVVHLLRAPVALRARSFTPPEERLRSG